MQTPQHFSARPESFGVLVGFRGFSWVFVGFRGIFVGFRGIFVGFRGIFVGFRGFSWVFVGFRGIFVGFRGIFVGFRGIFVGFRGFSWDFRGFSWVFVGFSWVFVGFSWVFVGFSWVFVGIALLVRHFFVGASALRTPVFSFFTDFWPNLLFWGFFFGADAGSVLTWACGPESRDSGPLLARCRSALLGLLAWAALLMCSCCSQLVYRAFAYVSVVNFAQSWFETKSPHEVPHCCGPVFQRDATQQVSLIRT